MAIPVAYDIILATYLVALLTLGTVAFVVTRTTETRFPWGWLSWFCALYAVSLSLYFFGVAFSGNPLLLAIRLILLLGSLLMLLEFTRRSSRALGIRTPGPWIHLLPLLPGLVGTAGGGETLLVTATLIPGWCGVAWVTFVVIRLWRVASIRQQLLLFALTSILAFFGFTLTAQITLPLTTHRIAKILSGFMQDIPPSVTPELIMAGMLFWAAAALWFHANDGQRRIYYVPFGLMPALLLLLFAGGLAANFSEHFARAENTRSLLLRTRTAAAGINAALVARLRGNPDDRQLPEFATLLDQINVMRRINPDIRNIYLLAQRQNRVIFLLDPTAAEIRAQPGIVPAPNITYDEVTPAMAQVFASGQPAVDDLTSARGSIWVTGMAPVTGSSGASPAILVMDIDGYDWLRILAEYRLVAIGLTLILCLLVQGFFIIIVMIRAGADRVAALESRFLTMFMNAPEAIIIYSEATGTIIRINPFAAQWLGYRTEELIGRPLTLIAPASAPGAAARYRRRDGEAVDVECTSSHIRYGGEECAIIFIRDITARRQADQALREAMAAAESATRAKGEFIANMSHEIRTPMNAVVGMTALLQATPLAADQRDYVETIRTSSDALLNVINDILDFSKMEMDRLELEALPFAIRDCVEEALEVVAPHAREKHLELAAQVAPEVPCYLRGDITRVRQVLVNLAGNAVKFTEHGSVTVSVDLAAPGRLRCRVRDTGIGIPAATIPRLFTSFTQADSSTTRRYGGSGLGLSICKNLLNRMGGDISVSSEPGVGSEFTFTLPAAAAAGKPQPWHGPVAELRGRRVLLADPAPVSAAALAALLGNWGMEVRQAATPDEIRRLLAGEPFAFALLSDDPPDSSSTIAAMLQARPGLRLFWLTAQPDDPRIPAGATRILRPVRAAALYRAFTGTDNRTADAGFSRELARQFPRRILIAEDNPVNQRVIRLLLNQFGYAPEVVGDGAAAVAAVRQQAYDLVLMDIQMPGMDGLAAARQIRRAAGLRQPRIIALTAGTTEDEWQAALAAGMDGFISKPLRVVQLRELLMHGRHAAAAGESATAAAADGAAAIFDEAALGQYRQLGDAGADIVRELVELFLQETPARLDALAQLAGAGERENLARAAHALKGSCSVLGLSQLARLCLDLQLTAATRAADTLAPAVAELRAAYAAGAAALRQRLAQAGGN